MSIVNRIKQVTQEKQISISTIETELQLSPKSIYRWDKSEPSISKVVAVANFLQVPLIWLATGSYSDYAIPDGVDDDEISNNNSCSTLLERIKEASQNKGITIKYLEQQLGFSNGTIGKWEKSSPTVDRLVAVADFLQVSLLWLLNRNEDSLKDNNIIAKYELLPESDKKRIANYIEISLTDSDCLSKIEFQTQQFLRINQYRNLLSRIAILGYVAAGFPIEGISTPLGYADPLVPADYVLIAKGNSMEPVIFNKEYIYVKNQSTLDNGDIGIFYIDGEVTCKIYQPKDDCILLCSLNPEFKPFKYSLNEEHDFKIQGKVILTNEQRARLPQ